MTARLGFGVARIRRGFLCIVSSNRVMRALCLIRRFVRSRGYLYGMGLDWFRFVYVMLYVGRIAVLFLFVIMRLEDTSSHPLRWRSTLPRGIPFVVASMLAITRPSYVVSADIGFGSEGCGTATTPVVLRNIMYGYWSECLMMRRRLLVVGMVGSIVVRLEPRTSSRFVPRFLQQTRNPVQTVRFL